VAAAMLGVEAAVSLDGAADGPIVNKGPVSLDCEAK